MGYYTYYVLDVRRYDGKQVDGALLKEIYRQLVDINSFEFGWRRSVEHEKIDHVYELNELLFPDQTKWYDRDKDMLELSSRVKDVVFELTGEGEHNGDNWRMFYLNGMCGGGGAEIIYPEFDISTMRRPEEAFSDV